MHFFHVSFAAETKTQKNMEKKLTYLPPATQVVALVAPNALMQSSPMLVILQDYGNEITTEWI